MTKSSNQLKLGSFSDEELNKELARRKELRRNSEHISNLSPVGIWSVTTEGDCEGKSIRQLGTFKGHVVDIAKRLATEAVYGLRFVRRDEDNFEISGTENRVKEVHISLGINSGTWPRDMNNEEAIYAFSNFLDKSVTFNDYCVDESEYYACVKLNFNV